MKRRLSIFALSILSGSFSVVIAQQKDLVDTALIRFWKSNTMYYESVMMISEKGELPVANLLFRPDKIVSVKSAGLDIDYKEGIDWAYTNGKLTLLKNSSAVYLTGSELFPDTSGNTFPKKAGGFILFKEGSYFHNHQLAVTYTHAPGLWKGAVPSFQKKNLPHAIRKLRKKSTLHLLLFGDSIAAGYNASGETHSPPYLPSWGNLISEGLKRYYKAPVRFTNTSISGKDSRWALNTVQERVLDYHPDLVIIAFGMNDGTSRMEPELFKSNIEAIIKKVKQQNAKAEFILVAPMLPNPASNFTGTQASFKNVLEELTGKGIVRVDMTSVHSELLKYKSYQDMTGNHINHPNDFLIRWYAQQILSTLIPDR